MVELLTGETVELPLSLQVSVTGAVFSASRAGVEEILPDGLTPIRATRDRAAVTLVCNEFERVGRTGEIEPYDEFVLNLPAVPESESTIPYLSALTQGTTGYVWTLVGPNETAQAIGDIWGLPTVTGSITHEETGSGRETRVAVDGDHLVTVEVKRPPTFEQTDSATAYTVNDDTLWQYRQEFDGRIGLWPFSTAVSYELGDHPLADRLRDLDLGSRALARFAAETEYLAHAGQPVRSE